MVETSVVIPCYIFDDTLLKLTERCICSVRDTSDVELIVVDNGSLIGSEFLKSEADIYIRNQKNLGYVKALNQGLKLCTKEYIVIGSNDVVVPQDWEAVYKDILDNTKDCGAVIACDTDDKEKTIWKDINALGYWSMIRRERLFDVGLFDERFFTTWGDVDYAFRLEKKGLHHLTTSEVIFKHYCKATRDKLFDLEIWDYKEGRKRFIEKWQDDPDGQRLLKEYNLV